MKQIQKCVWCSPSQNLKFFCLSKLQNNQSSQFNRSKNNLFRITIAEDSTIEGQVRPVESNCRSAWECCHQCIQKWLFYNASQKISANMVCSCSRICMKFLKYGLRVQKLSIHFFAVGDLGIRCRFSENSTGLYTNTFWANFCRWQLVLKKRGYPAKHFYLPSNIFLKGKYSIQ